MAESARGNDAPLIPERGSSYAHPKVSEDVLIRFQSLLEARNRQIPPRIPHSFHQHSFIPRTTYRDPFAAIPTCQTSDLRTSEGPVAKLTPLEIALEGVSDLDINRFDGPAGQIDGDHIDGTWQRPTQSELTITPEARDREKNSNALAGHQRVSMGNPRYGQNNSTPSDNANLGRKDTPLKLPQDASATPPTYPWLKEKRLRPGMQHVPGSFGSPLDPHVERGSGILSPTLDEDPAPALVEPRVHPVHHVPATTAVESLLHAKDVDARSLRSKGSLREKSSQTSLKSVASTRYFIKPHSDLSHLRQVAQPVVTPAKPDYGSLDSLSLGTRAPAAPESLNSERRGTAVAEAVEPSGLAGPVTNTPIEQLLAELPPIKQPTIDDLDTSQVLLQPKEQKSQLNLQEKTIREHSREMSSHDEVSGQSFDDCVDLPLQTTQPEDRVPKTRRHSLARSVQSRSSPSTPLSVASRKAASLSRAITALSQFSSTSNLRTLPLRSSTNYDRIESAEETASTDAARHGVTSGFRSKWVQGLLNRSSTMPATSTSHLTARPSDRRKSAQAAKIAKQGSNDENFHHDRTTTGLTDPQALSKGQQQDAENFSRTIFELESLLREALVIAHQAADKEDDSMALAPRQPSIRYLTSPFVETVGSNC